MENIIQNIKESLHKGFIDRKYMTSGRYTPRLLINNEQNKVDVLSSLIEELENCSSFIFSVAFITESGLATLKSHLLDLKHKGINGRILTSTFLHFNQPKVFKELRKITNVEVRLADRKGFHAKGYIFSHPHYQSLIVGSSNLTAQALKVNYEWNVKLTSHDNGDIVHHFSRQFEDVWNQAKPLTDEWITQYAEIYKPADFNGKIVEMPKQYEANSIEESIMVTPNKMQQAALRQIQAVRDDGFDKGLVISATGTGKTYLSAFDVRRFAPKKVLFIVHREQILKKAQKDFRRILGGIDEDFGILSGSIKDTHARYLFATIQTISKENTLSGFAKDEFDYILIDEVHKAGAASYQRVMQYFNPRFLLGMTATPERTDNFNIYELFDYHIAYEIRLQEALEEDMLCPFHYFGVTDFMYHGELLDDTALLSHLVTSERVQHIMDKIHYYGFSGSRVRGLIFCSRKEEAKELSKAMNQKGYQTVALTGDNSQEERLEQVNHLEDGQLDYIVTVDIFNEGIDIPSINQVVMLRQTESSIVFIQQLGRGLRKHHSKDFVTIIDFIGNYKNNYLIPIALSGDQSQNKDNIRRNTQVTNYIKGVSTVHFEEIAKKQIFQSINKSKLTAMKVLKNAFLELKNRLGRTPYLYDFITNHSIDPVIIASKKNGHKNYYQFLLKMKEDVPLLTDYESRILTMLSTEVLDGKRLHECVLLSLLLNEDQVEHQQYIHCLKKEGCRTDDLTLNSVIRVLDLSFFNESDQHKYGDSPLIVERDNVYWLHADLDKSLAHNHYFYKLVWDILQSAEARSKRYQQNLNLTKYEKYSRKDACKLLNWEKDESSTMYGYKPKHHTCPIFITYHKEDDVDKGVDYGDEFLSPHVLKWYTRRNRTLRSPEVNKIINADAENATIHIFMQRRKGEKGFYYLGEAIPDQLTIEQSKMTDKNGTLQPVVHMNMVMKNAVEHSLFHYIVDNNGA